MEQFLEFYNTLNVNWHILTVMMLMSVFVAIFHTLIIGALWNINLKPKWLFFVLNPAIIGFSALIDRKIGALIFCILFISVFVFGIISMFLLMGKSVLESTKEKDKNRIKMGKKPLPWWKKLIGTLFAFTVFIFLISLGVPYFILIFFIILPFLASIFSKSNKKAFYKLQRILPTSNIRSVAMGLAEIAGNAKTIESMVSKIGKKKCIGYLYTIENISRDDEGRYSYTLEFKETICNPFFLEDKTGKIKVESKEIEFIDFEIDEQYQSSMKRYTQYILVENSHVLLIGKAGIATNNEAVFQKEDIKNVFGIAPIESVQNYNDLRPLLQSAGFYIYFWVILIAIILLTPIQLKNNTIEIGKISWKLPFKNSKPVNTIFDFYDNIYDSYEKNEEIEPYTNEAEGTEVVQPALPKENEIVLDSIK